MAKADLAAVCSLLLEGHKQGLGGEWEETANWVYDSLVMILGI